MILVRLIGGLGNQMFQYAAARSLSDRLGVELVLDIRAFDHYNLHAFGLNRFSIRGRSATPAELSRWPTWMRRPCRLAQRFGIATRWYSEPHFAYDTAWPSLGDNIMLDGYFQSEKYFASIAHGLRGDFFPRSPMSAENTAIAELAREAESVMIHVRRGDYVKNAKTLRIHGVCSPAYYESAIAVMKKRLTRPRFFVFSNDMDWARENLKLGDDAVFVLGNDKAPEMDVHLMAQCRHHIIANSSFSWWGAWLGKNEGQAVVAPSPWFNTMKLDASDLLVDGWHCLNRE